MRGGVLALALAAGPVAAGPTPLDRVFDQPGFDGFWGVEVREVATGRVLYSRNADRNFHPASTLKLLATATALDALGSDWRPVTTVVTGAGLDDHGVLAGDLELVGGGDPNLSGRFREGRPTAGFEDLAETLWGAGLRRVERRVVGRDPLFEGERRGVAWAWEDLVWWYGAEVSALSFNDNCVDLRVRAGATPGAPAAVEVDPPTAYVQVENAVATSASGGEPDLVLRRDLDSTLIRLGGVLPHRGPPVPLHVAMPDPARYAATVFAEVLARRGIGIGGGIATASGASPPGARVLARLEGRTVGEMIAVANKESQNLHAEMLLRLAAVRSGGAGSVEGGVEAERALAARLGIALTLDEVADGSGLSPSNLVKPRDVVALLVAMAHHPQAGPFRDSLAVAGVDGTLRHRLAGGPAGRVRAKTGTVKHVNALAGYAVGPGGREIAFAIVANHHGAAPAAVVHAIDAAVGLIVEGRWR